MGRYEAKNQGNLALNHLPFFAACEIITTIKNKRNDLYPLLRTPLRHCEEQSDVAIHVTAWIAAPLTGARNDEWGSEARDEEWKIHKIIRKGYMSCRLLNAGLKERLLWIIGPISLLWIAVWWSL